MSKTTKKYVEKMLKKDMTSLEIMQEVINTISEIKQKPKLWEDIPLNSYKKLKDDDDWKHSDIDFK